MVVISSPSCIAAKQRQEFTRRPLMCTVHAPHWPWSHPFFEPVRCRCSRRQSRRVVRGSIRKSYFLPLTASVTGIASFASDVSADCFADFSLADVMGPVDAIKLAMPHLEIKLRRVDRPNSPRFSSLGLSSRSFGSDIGTPRNKESSAGLAQTQARSRE